MFVLAACATRVTSLLSALGVAQMTLVLVSKSSRVNELSVPLVCNPLVMLALGNKPLLFDCLFGEELAVSHIGGLFDCETLILDGLFCDEMLMVPAFCYKPSIIIGLCVFCPFNSNPPISGILGGGFSGPVHAALLSYFLCQRTARPFGSKV